MRDYPTHLRISDVSHPLLVIRGENDPIAKAQWCDWLLQQVREGEPGHSSRRSARHRPLAPRGYRCRNSVFHDRWRSSAALVVRAEVHQFVGSVAERFN